MHGWIFTLLRGPLGRLLGARGYVTGSLVVTAALLAVTTVTGVQFTGAWPPAPLRPHVVSISGPGTSGAASQIQAEVLGAVRLPGVYELPEGSRVRDLVGAAGGLLTAADVSALDLAALVGDGEEVYVPYIGQPVPAELGGKVALNLATAEQLHEALGISLAIARRIVAYRVTHGSYSAVSQLLLVPVSRTTYDRIKDLVTV